MKKTALKLLIFLMAFVLVSVKADAVLAAPRLTLSPVSGTYTNGSTFTVSIGVNSDTEKSSAVDVWSTFDKSRLEVVSIVKSTNPPFPFELNPKFDNTAGTFQFSCVPTNMSAFDDTVINGELAVVTFKAKALGTAALNFTCTAGSTVDSNIFDSDINDVISCGSNDVGSYIITEGSSTTPTSTPTPTPTTTSSSTNATSTPTPTSTTSTTSTTLPQTGAIGSTVGLMIFGVIGLASALFLKFL